MSASYSVLSLNDPEGIHRHLAGLGWLERDEQILNVARAGEGNMNLVVRVTTDRRSVILKQSRPWVEKYPSIPAPEARLLVEAAFYRAVADEVAVAGMMPDLLHVDPDSRSALIEDLGQSSDCTALYDGAEFDLTPLVQWLGSLHGLEVESTDLLRNRAMRDLNHAHIFDLPMTGEHGMNLDDVTPGLQSVAEDFRRRPGLAGRVADLGELYLADGGILLHGDFYPGSWLRTDSGLKVIDPEFCFLGPAEFDVGVLLAHLQISGFSSSQCTGLLDAYPHRLDRTLAWRFAGVEVMRRLNGVAQLPIERGLKEKTRLLAQAESLIAA